MPWYVYALLTAMAVAGRDIYVKAGCRELSVEEVAGVEMAWSLPVFAAGILLVPWPPLDATFWWMLFWSFPVNILAYFLYLYAIKVSPLTLTVPFLSFTPAFMIITGLLFLGEEINRWGGAGIACIVGGSYLLNIDTAKAGGLLGPLKALVRERGSWFMLLVAFLYAFGAVLGKKGILHSSPIFFGFSFFFGFSLLILLGLAISGRLRPRQLIDFKRQGLWLGGLLAVHVVCHNIAISLVTAAYMIAVKRCSILFSVLAGGFYLREANFGTRLAGAAMMFAGMLLIILGGS
ncbi:MAG: DMT family transporter [Deltaproteobacteria bacterium]